MPNWLFHMLEVRRRLWFTVALYSAFGVLAALVAARFGRYVPGDFPVKLGSDAVDDLLSVLASSMLAVATFSLATLVTAYTSVVASISPHAARLLVSVGAIRNTLATFIGAFVYGMVGIVALHTGYYGAEGRVILFFFTVAVLVGVIVAMLRWVGELSSLGQSNNVIGRVAEATAEALRAPTSRPSREAPTNPPQAGCPVFATQMGFVQNVDIAGLEKMAAAWGVQITLGVQPGDFVRSDQAVLWVAGGTLDDEGARRLQGRITLGAERTHRQDPRYGMQVLGEIASRALSPGVNDPGTARDVLTRTVMLIRDWSAEATRRVEEDAHTARVVKPALSSQALLQEALEPVIRHGAGDASLQVDLQHALAALAALGDAELSRAAWTMSREALGQAREALGHSGSVPVRRAALAVVAAARAPASPPSAAADS